MKIAGYPIVFDSSSVDLGFIEVIRGSAVDRALRERSDVVALRNHDSTLALGRTSAGTLALRKDPRGLHVELDADESVSYVGDLVRLIQRGDARGGSFAFRALDDVWSLNGDTPFREVIDMTLKEVSIGVSFPAYPATNLIVGVNGQPPRSRGLSIGLAQRQLQLAMIR